MGTPVSAVKIQHTASRETNDLQNAVKKLATQLNASVLAKKELGNVSDSIPGGLWAAPNTDSFLVLKNIEASCVLARCAMSFVAAVTKDPQNYRLIKLVRFNGPNEYVVAEIDTNNQGFPANTAVTIPVTAKSQDLLFSQGDVLKLNVTSSGNGPLLGEGVFSLSWELR